jgi:hypothetical protein
VAVVTVDLLLDAIYLASLSTYIFLLIFLYIKSFVDYSSEQYINRVSINSVDRKIIISYYNYASGQTSEVLDFDKTKIKIKRSPWTKRPNSLLVFRGKKTVFEISRNKDGFPAATIEELSQYLESLTSPVSSKV